MGVCERERCVIVFGVGTLNESSYVCISLRVSKKKKMSK